MESVDLESIGEASDQDYFPEQFTEKAAKPKKSGLFRRKKKLDREGRGIHDVVKICNTNFQNYYRTLQYKNNLLFSFYLHFSQVLRFAKVSTRFVWQYGISAATGQRRKEKTLVFLFYLWYVLRGCWCQLEVSF